MELQKTGQGFSDLKKPQFLFSQTNFLTYLEDDNNK